MLIFFILVLLVFDCSVLLLVVGTCLNKVLTGCWRHWLALFVLLVCTVPESRPLETIVAIGSKTVVIVMSWLHVCVTSICTLHVLEVAVNVCQNFFLYQSSTY